uniref:Tetratricopeptide repeat protein n=1 Tax=Meloidogyne incognita TaxID=6306 RepID=A0A914NY93_MELIC
MFQRRKFRHPYIFASSFGEKMQNADGLMSKHFSFFNKCHDSRTDLRTFGNMKRPFDCFEIGRIAYNEEDYFHSLLWMQEALDRVKREMPPSIAESEILEYLAFALFKQGNIKHALITTDRLYEIAPSHPRAKGNIK